MKRVTLLIPLLLFVIGILGCAALKHSYYKGQYIESQVQSYTYTTDFDYVWQQARALLFQKGYPVIGYDRRSKTMETDWVRVDNKENTFRRYLVSGYRASDGSNTVHFDYYEETHNPGYRPASQTGRDYQLEYQLIHIVEPSKWAEIEQNALEFAEKKSNQ